MLKDLQDANVSVPENHVKSHSFFASPRKKWLRPRPQNTINSCVFVTSHARSTVNYSDFGPSVVYLGVGRRQGRPAYIRPGAPWPRPCRTAVLSSPYGCAPCRRPTPPPPKTPAFYGVLCSSHFFHFFGSCGSRWVNMGQHGPQDGPT